MRFVRLDSDFTLVLVYIFFLNAEEITKYTIIFKFTDLLGLIYWFSFPGNWNQCQQKNDLRKHKQLTLRTAFSNAKDTSHIAEPTENKSENVNNDFGVDLYPHTIDMDE